jgi:glycosyltransferase involved in cell wall biosynthesis
MAAMNVVMFGGPTAWDGSWYSRHHLTAGLARRHRVFAVTEPRDARSAVQDPRLFLRRAHIGRDSQGVLRYAPPGWLPAVYRWRRLRSILSEHRHRALVRMLQRERAIPAIYYVWRPDYQEAVEGIVGSPLVYHCYDRYDEYTGASNETVRQWESWLAHRAAVCVAASLKVSHHLCQLGAREVVLLRHGVDSALFRPDVPAHSDLRNIPRPRLGLVASLTNAIDVQTLLHVARQRPDWSLVIVGGISFQDAQKRRDFDRLCGLPNVHHVGLRPRTEMPAWIAGLDACLMCFDLATWGPSKQPLKMYEYLACGMPVVSSDIAAAQELGDLIARAAARDEWVPMIERVLAQNGPAQVDRRVAFARANSWDQRIAELEGILLGISERAAG